MKQYLMCILVYLGFINLLLGAEAEHTFTGVHFFGSYYECDEMVLNDKEILTSSLIDAINLSGATLLKLVDYQFDPQGVTIVALLSESHASVHTYPEFNACFVDFFTCGNQCDYTKFNESFKAALKAQKSNSQCVLRS